MNLSKNTTKVVILDTGCANLSSVKYAIERLGYAPIVTADPDLVINSDKLFLPGVGTASAAMAQLENRNLIQLIKRCKQPILGICLGMQLLASHSEEGDVDTLGLIDESIVKISNHGLPLPHMGWNNVNFDKTNPLFKNIPDNSYFYFVHSFALPICDFTIAQAHYGEDFTAAVQKNNYFGVQFHPERSGSVGATLLKNFLEM